MAGSANQNIGRRSSFLIDTLARMSTTLSIVALVVAVVSAGTSVGLWRSAKNANSISAGLATIEARRRHEEETPTFDITIAQRSTALDHADLEVKLLSPEHLDQVVVTILDEAGQDHWGHGLPSGVDQQEAALFVWGPWQFNTGATAQVQDTRTSRPREYSLVNGKNTDLLDLVRTRPGHWMSGTTQQAWERDREGLVRLRIECRLDGHESWNVFRDVRVRKVASIASAADVRIPLTPPWPGSSPPRP